MGLMKYCDSAGCNRLVPQGTKYCAVHTIRKPVAGKPTAENPVKNRQGNRQRHKEYDAHRRNKKAKDFYNSAAWLATRRRVMARDAGIDIYLYITEHRIVPADTVHHIVELKENYTKRCDPDNLISLSSSTHSMISKAYKESVKRKAEMQQTLRECMQEYKRKLNGG